MRLEANHCVGAGGEVGEGERGEGKHGQAVRWAKWWGEIWDMVKSHNAGWRRAVDAPESAYVLPMQPLWEGTFWRWVGAARRAREVRSVATCKSRGACFFSVRQCGE